MFIVTLLQYRYHCHIIVIVNIVVIIISKIRKGESASKLKQGSIANRFVQCSKISTSESIHSLMFMITKVDDFFFMLVKKCNSR